MEKSHLVVVGGNGIPLWGYCSSCKDVRFQPGKEQKDELAQKASMRAQLDRHYLKRHLNEGGLESAIEEEIKRQRGSD